MNKCHGGAVWFYQTVLRSRGQDTFLFFQMFDNVTLLIKRMLISVYVNYFLQQS